MRVLALGGSTTGVSRAYYWVKSGVLARAVKWLLMEHRPLCCGCGSGCSSSSRARALASGRVCDKWDGGFERYVRREVG